MDDKDLVELTQSVETIFKGNFLHLKRAHVLLPTGEPAQREFIEHPGAVMILAIDLEAQTIVVERQYRAAVAQVFWELPAGKKSPGETALECAKRELNEETGYQGDFWQCLGAVHPCIGYADERIDIFVCLNLQQGERCLDEGELLHVTQMKVPDLLEMVFEGSITDAKTIAGLLWAKRLLDKFQSQF